MINRLLFNLTKRMPCKLINVHGEPYLERYFAGELFGVTFYLHRFLSCDGDEHPDAWHVLAHTGEESDRAAL